MWHADTEIYQHEPCKEPNVKESKVLDFIPCSLQSTMWETLKCRGQICKYNSYLLAPFKTDFIFDELYSRALSGNWNIAICKLDGESRMMW